MTLSGKAPRSRLEAEPVARRDWLGWAGLGTMGGALLFGLVGLLRLPKAAVLASPAKKYKIALPEALAPGTPFLPPGRGVAIFKDAQGVYAISTTCTHLGCVIKPTEEGFECPCHGSRFHANGEVAKGPAPRALPWFKVTVGGGAVQVDEGATVEAGTKVAV